MHEHATEGNEHAMTDISRRTIARGGAWAASVVALAAPAAAAATTPQPCTTPPLVTSVTAHGHWYNWQRYQDLTFAFPSAAACACALTVTSITDTLHSTWTPATATVPIALGATTVTIKNFQRSINIAAWTTIMGNVQCGTEPAVNFTRHTWVYAII